MFTEKITLCGSIAEGFLEAVRISASVSTFLSTEEVERIQNEAKRLVQKDRSREGMEKFLLDTFRLIDSLEVIEHQSPHLSYWEDEGTEYISYFSWEGQWSPGKKVFITFCWHPACPESDESLIEIEGARLGSWVVPLEVKKEEIGRSDFED